MSAESYLLDVVHGRNHTPVARPLRGGLAVLSWCYNACLKLFLAPYRLGVRRQTQLDCTVVSVGNLTVGGTGKTPTVIALTQLLVQAGLRVCILSRGYKGRSEHGAEVVSTYTSIDSTSANVGDEAYLLAKSLRGIPVLVGKDRRVTGRMAIERFNPDVVLLDDGMQFYQLHRDVEIVLLNATDPFDNGWTFPRGLLREPPSHLRRASVIILTNANAVPSEQLDALRIRAARLNPTAPILTASTAPSGVRPLGGGSVLPVEWLGGRSIATWCALGSPDTFEAQVEALGPHIVLRERKPDHAGATLQELEAFILQAAQLGAEAVVVSEKDAVKLPPLRKPIPFVSLRATLNIEGVTALVQDIRSRVEALRRE